MSNRQFVDELHKSVIRKLIKRKVYYSFIDNVYGVDLQWNQCWYAINKQIQERDYAFIMRYGSFY